MCNAEKLAKFTHLFSHTFMHHMLTYLTSGRWIETVNMTVVNLHTYPITHHNSQPLLSLADFFFFDILKYDAKGYNWERTHSQWWTDLVQSFLKVQKVPLIPFTKTKWYTTHDPREGGRESALTLGIIHAKLVTKAEKRWWWIPEGLSSQPEESVTSYTWCSTSRSYQLCLASCGIKCKNVPGVGSPSSGRALQ